MSYNPNTSNDPGPIDSGFVGTTVRQILSIALSSTAMASYLNQNDAVAIASGAGALASLGWSLYSHWGMKKVPVAAIVLPPPTPKV